MDLKQLTEMDPAAMGKLIDYFEELSSKLDNLPDFRNVSPDSSFVSCIRFDGSPILPPILTHRRKEEMVELKRQAMRCEEQVRCSQRERLRAKAKAIVAKSQAQGSSTVDSHSYTQAADSRQRRPLSSASYTKIPASKTSPDRAPAVSTHSRIPVHQNVPRSTQAAEPADESHRLRGSSSYTVLKSAGDASETSQAGALNDLSVGGLSESQPFTAFREEGQSSDQLAPAASRSYTISSEQSFLTQSGLLGAGELTGPAGTLAVAEEGLGEEGLATIDSLASDLPSMEDTPLPTDFNGLPLTSIRQQQISQVLAKLSKVLNIKDSLGFNSTSSSEVSEMTLTMQQVMTAAQQPGGLASFPLPLPQGFSGGPQSSQDPVSVSQGPGPHPQQSAPPAPQISISQPALRQHMSEGDLSIFHESQDTVVEVEREMDSSASEPGQGCSPENDLSRGEPNRGLNDPSPSSQSNPSPQHNSSVSSVNTSCTSDSQRSNRSSPRSSKNTVRFSSTVTEFSASQMEGKVSKRRLDLAPAGSLQGPQTRDPSKPRGGQSDSLLSRVAFNPDMESSTSSASEHSPEVPFGAYELSGSDKENDAKAPPRDVQHSRGSSQSVGSSQTSTVVGDSQSLDGVGASQGAGGRDGTVCNSLSSQRSAVTSATSESGSSTLRGDDASFRGSVTSSSAGHNLPRGQKLNVGQHFFPPLSIYDDENEVEMSETSAKGPANQGASLPQGFNVQSTQPLSISSQVSKVPAAQGTSQQPAASKDSTGQNPSHQVRSTGSNQTSVFQPDHSSQSSQSSQPKSYFNPLTTHLQQNGLSNGISHPEELRPPAKKFHRGHVRKGSYTLEAPSPVLLHAQSVAPRNGEVGVETLGVCPPSSVLKPLSRKLDFEDEDEMDAEVLRAQPVSLPMPEFESQAKVDHINKYLSQLEQQRALNAELSPQTSQGLPQRHGTSAPDAFPSQVAANLAAVQSILSSLESYPNISQEELLSLQTQQFELTRQALVEQQQRDLEELFVLQRREQMSLQREIEEHQKALHEQQEFLVENDPENLKPAKAHSPEDNTQVSKPQNSFTYVSSPSLCRHPRDRDDLSTFSQTTPKQSLFPKNATPSPRIRKPVLQSPYRPIPMPKRSAKVVVPTKAFEPEMRAKFCHLSAVAKGFLTRRLLKTDKVQELIKTIQDTRQFAFTVQAETPIKRGKFSHQDRDLLERIIAQLQAALLDIHEIFFLIPLPDRMALIALSREKQRARQYKTSRSSELRGSNPRLSAATLKALERKRKAQEAEIAVFGSTQTRPRTAPSTSSPRCQSHSTDLRALRPIQGQISPIHPDPSTARSERERPKTAPEKSKLSQAGNRRKSSSTSVPTSSAASSRRSVRSDTQVKNRAAGNKTKTRPSSSKAWRE